MTKTMVRKPARNLLLAVNSSNLRHRSTEIRYFERARKDFLGLKYVFYFFIQLIMLLDGVFFFKICDSVYARITVNAPFPRIWLKKTGGCLLRLQVLCGVHRSSRQYMGSGAMMSI